MVVIVQRGSIVSMSSKLWIAHLEETFLRILLPLDFGFQFSICFLVEDLVLFHLKPLKLSMIIQNA